jgi:galactose mutarotase-like enzyme
MYLGPVKDWFSSLYHTVWRRNLMRSGMLTVLILAGVLVGLAVGYRAHMQGNFHKLKAKMSTEHQDAPVPRPGGREAISLMRTRLVGDAMPEFLSVTMLPGRGMNVLQITAYVPGRGEVNLLTSPSVDDAANAMTGNGADEGGEASLTMGGAFEAPWTGRMWGTPLQDSARIATEWRGHDITLPASGGETGAVAKGGLMLARSSDSVETSAMPDGGDAQVVFHAGDFGVHWPAGTDVTVAVLLNSRTIDLTMVATNTGNEPEPIGIGWIPRFAILGADRQELRVRIPGEMRAERRGDGGQPTGKLLPVAGTPYDFSMRGGAKLGTMSLDDSFVGLHQSLMDNGPSAELSDPGDNFGIRLIAMSPTIKEMRLVAPADGNFVSIAPEYNYPDPFGREWKADTDTGMVVLQPGQSTEWKVRLELFSLANGASPTE